MKEEQRRRVPIAEQEFLVSFAVDIDEAGLDALQSALSENTSLAEALADAFSAAKSSIAGFFDQLSASTLSTGETSPYQRLLDLADSGIELSMTLDTSEAQAALDNLQADAEEPIRLEANADALRIAGETALQTLLNLYKTTKLPLMADNTNVLLMGQSALSELLSEYGSTELPLNADASQVISEGVSALNTLKSKYSSTTLTIKAKVSQTGTGTTTGTDTGGGGGGVTLQQRAMGGRFTERTLAEIAEDGDPEYVIPVKKESLAVPLLRQLLSELSDSAKETLRGDLGQGAGSGESLAGLADMFSSARGATGPVIQQTANSNVQAPVSIQVQASGSDPEAIGRSIYDVAERYLIRTLEGALQ